MACLYLSHFKCVSSFGEGQPLFVPHNRGMLLLILIIATQFAMLTAIAGDLFFSAVGMTIHCVVAGGVGPHRLLGSYILLTSETDKARHFHTRTDEKGEYLFGGIPAGNYTVSIYAWFPKRSEVPCQNSLEQKTVDGGDITVEWQWKSQAFMEIVRLKGFSIEFDRENVKDFDLVARQKTATPW